MQRSSDQPGVRWNRTSSAPVLDAVSRVIAMKAAVSRIGAFAEYVRTSKGWRRPLLAFAAGALSIFAFPPFFFSPVLFLTLPVSAVAERARQAIGSASAEAASAKWLPAPGDLWRGLKIGWWFGFGFHFRGTLLDRRGVPGSGRGVCLAAARSRHPDAGRSGSCSTRPPLPSWRACPAVHCSACWSSRWRFRQANGCAATS